MSPKAIVTCRMCQKKFERLEWLQNKECDSPEVCSCPEVQRAMRAANDTINKAKKVVTPFVVERTNRTLFTQCRTDGSRQLTIQVQPLQVIEVKKQRK